MGMLKDSCFHQPEVNGDPHEELTPPAPPPPNLSYSTLICPLVCEFSSLGSVFHTKHHLRKVGTKCFGCFLLEFLSGIIIERGFYLFDAALVFEEGDYR